MEEVHINREERQQQRRKSWRRLPVRQRGPRIRKKELPILKNEAKRKNNRKSIEIKAFAKINLSLDVLERLDDGYHRIETVMQQVGLWDDIIIESLGNAGIHSGYGITLKTDSDTLSHTEENLAYKAAVVMAEAFCPLNNNKFLITLNKRIPIAAGLAGGSSDAAAVMLGLCRLWNLNVSLRELCAMGVKLGADVPFCIIANAKNNPGLGFSEDEMASSAALGEGIGEKLTVLPSLKGWIVLVRPHIAVSTGFVYEQLSAAGVFSGSANEWERPNTKELISDLKSQNTEAVTKNMLNVLETVSLKEYPVIVYTKNKVGLGCTPNKVLMSGSGPTVFGYYESEGHAGESYTLLRRVFSAETQCRFDLYLAELL